MAHTTLDFLDLANVRANYFDVSYPDTVTEIYTFRKNGPSDPIVCQITIVYTDATKSFIANGTRNTPSALG